MKKRNLTPMVLSILLIGLVCIFTAIRINHQNIWKNYTLNFDIVLSLMYIIWILFESRASKRDATMEEQTSDYGTCELYALGQGAVIISALWCAPYWEAPNRFHILGFMVLLGGLFLRGWAIISLGQHYSHKVKDIKGHEIITKGPYHYIRHPAYTGMLLANAGIVLFFLNALTTFFFFLVLIPAVLLRIVVEEKKLFKIKGYAKFAKPRKRIIPLLW